MIVTSALRRIIPASLNERKGAANGSPPISLLRIERRSVFIHYLMRSGTNVPQSGDLASR